jgi:hypothetical protein
MISTLSAASPGPRPEEDGYFVSLWDVCFRQKRQYFFISSFPLVVLRFVVVT